MVITYKLGSLIMKKTIILLLFINVGSVFSEPLPKALQHIPFETRQAIAEEANRFHYSRSKGIMNSYLYEILIGRITSFVEIDKNPNLFPEHKIILIRAFEEKQKEKRQNNTLGTTFRPIQ
jgi:hypothetical protein